MSDEMIVNDGPRQETIKVNYPSNAKKDAGKHKAPIIEPVVTGQVIKRKRPLFSRLGDNLKAEDSGSVGEYIILEVLLPAAKNMISDAVSQGIDRILFGSSSPRRSADTRPGYTNYNRVRPTGAYETRRDDISHRARARHQFDEIILATRAEAEDVLEGLRELISVYEVAKVTDLYELLNFTGEFTDERWGWTDLRNARIKAVRGGYLLDLPKTEPLD